MKNLRYIIIFAFTGSILVSCKPEQVFPDEPMLSFKEYQYNGADTLKTVFSFTDGDGDIGVAPTGNDINMMLTLYYKDQNGEFQVARPGISTTDSITYPFRIPELPDGQNGLEGDIYLIVNSAFIQYDVIQFNAYIVDQTNHKSSVIRTPEFALH